MNLKFRQAVREDLPEIVRMLADDFLGATRERYENPLPESYLKAFAEIEAEKNNELIVAILSEPSAVADGLSNSARGALDKSDYPSATADGSDKTIVGTVHHFYAVNQFSGRKTCNGRIGQS